MREFFTANCGTVLKKPCADKEKESEDCGNPEATERSSDWLVESYFWTTTLLYIIIYSTFCY